MLHQRFAKSEGNPVKTRVTMLTWLCGTLLFVPAIFGQTTIFGGRGLYRTQSAETVGTGNLYWNGYFSMFMQKRSETVLDKDYTLSTAVTFGFWKHFETTLRLVPYQDDQKNIWPPPGQTLFGLKYHFPFSSSYFHLGFNNFLVIPMSNSVNVPYEPYSTDKLGWGTQLLATLSFENAVPTVPFKIHANVGYLDHNFQDQFFSSPIDQMLLRLGVVFPIRSFQIYTEYSAEVFVNQPAIDFNQNSVRLTQGFKFLGTRNVIFDLVFDLGLTNEDSVKAFDKRKIASPFLKDYADWKMTFGATYRFSLKRFFDKSDAEDRKKELEEQKKLEKIKERRGNATQDLENMKKVLDRNADEKDKKKE